MVILTVFINVAYNVKGQGIIDDMVTYEATLVLNKGNAILRNGGVQVSISRHCYIIGDGSRNVKLTKLRLQEAGPVYVATNCLVHNLKGVCTGTVQHLVCSIGLVLPKKEGRTFPTLLKQRKRKVKEES